MGHEIYHLKANNSVTFGVFIVWCNPLPHLFQGLFIAPFHHPLHPSGASHFFLFQPLGTTDLLSVLTGYK